MALYRNEGKTEKISLLKTYNHKNIIFLCTVYIFLLLKEGLIYHFILDVIELNYDHLNPFNVELI